MDPESMKSLKSALRYLVKSFECCGKEGSTWCGVTLSQWDTLVEIGDKGEMSLVDLAKGLNLDTSTLSRTVNGMVMLGLLERVQSVADRRFVTINLSQKGNELLEQINLFYENQLKTLLLYIPEERRELTLQVVLEFVAAAQKANAESTQTCCL